MTSQITWGVKREEMYKKRRNLIRKNINNLPSVQAAMGHAATSNKKVHINESLIRYIANTSLAVSTTLSQTSITNTYELQIERSYLRLMNLQKPKTVANEEFENYLEQISNNS